MITSSTKPFDDTWIVPSESKLDYYNGEMPLSPSESAYLVVQSYSDSPSTSTDKVNVVREESYSISS